MTDNIKTFTFGTCSFAKTSPDPLKDNTPVINVIVPFDEALKLNLALDECIRKLNKYKMSSNAGKRASVNLSIYVGKKRITVNEGKL